MSLTEYRTAHARKNEKHEVSSKLQKTYICVFVFHPFLALRKFDEASSVLTEIFSEYHLILLLLEYCPFTVLDDDVKRTPCPRCYGRASSGKSTLKFVIRQFYNEEAIQGLSLEKTFGIETHKKDLSEVRRSKKVIMFKKKNS